MQYVKFGNAGIEVSRLALGCMDFPTRLEETEAEKLVATAIENGINLLDTADGYGREGENETVLGRILKGKRDKLILATKFWVNMEKRVNGGGCSRVHIMQAVEDSLRRLQTDYIDLYQLHHPDHNTPAEETLSTLDTLIKQGKVRYIGVCNHYSWQMAHMLGISALHNWEPIVSYQCRYSILDRVIENEAVHFVQRFNIATMTYGGLCGGVLSGKIKRDEEPEEGSRVARLQRYREILDDRTYDVLDELQAIADKYQIGLNQLATAWLISKPYVTTVLLGGSKPEHFEQVYGVGDLEIAPEDLAAIDAISESCKFRTYHNQRIVQGAPLALNRF